MRSTRTFHPPVRLLLGPGPSNVEERVLRAMAAPLIGYFDPTMPEVTGEIRRLLQAVFGTTSAATFPLSGTGMSGMEAALVNLVEPGDTVVVGHHGFFGDRMLQLVERCGGISVPVAAAWGEPIPPERFEAALAKHPEAKVLAVVHAETSTGVLQPLDGLSALADRYGAFFLVDAVTSLGGHPVEVDRQRIDVCYSGTQKALSAPPGLSPVTFSERAMAHIRGRRRPVQSFYLDVALFDQYWSTNRFYHHTPPITFYYALLEALRMVEEEGLEARYARHRRNHLALVAGIEAMGLQMHVAAPHRLWTLNVIRIPEGADDARVRGRLLTEFGIEIGGGLGDLKGKVWRVGLMGVNSRRANVLLVLAALERILCSEGVSCGSGLAAAGEVYAREKAAAGK